MKDNGNNEKKYIDDEQVQKNIEIFRNGSVKSELDTGVSNKEKEMKDSSIKKELKEPNYSNIKKIIFWYIVLFIIEMIVMSPYLFRHDIGIFCFVVLLSIPIELFYIIYLIVKLFKCRRFCLNSNGYSANMYFYLKDTIIFNIIMILKNVLLFILPIYIGIRSNSFVKLESNETIDLTPLLFALALLFFLGYFIIEIIELINFIILYRKEGNKRSG